MSAIPSGATFIGTVAEFKRFTGAHWRVVVQQISKPHKAFIGQCQFCGKVDVPVDAAHKHGHERIKLIHDLLGSADPNASVEVDLTAFAAAFRAKHGPVEKAILVLCKPCHKAYDADAPSAATAEPVARSTTEAANDSMPLPITLEPRGEDAFRSAILKTRLAWIDVLYSDGSAKRQLWRANKLAAGSLILGNLRSRPEFRQGAFQKAGIVAVHVTVTTPEDADG